MQNYQEKPIPLVVRQPDQKYTVNPDALDLFLSVKGKLAVISVAGVYRTGKSYLLNTMLLNRKAGFEVGPTVNPQTKGIWVWGKPLIFKNKEDEIINVLVLDSEGLGSTEEDINHDLRLFSITLLLSSAFLYNTVGAIDENALDSLGLVLRLCEHLKNENFNDFPDFYWILRDFSLALLDKDEKPLTPKEYLQNCLNSQSADSDIRNKIRQSIKQAFRNRQCYAFVRPLLDEKSLQNLDNMQLQQLRPEFVEQVIDFRKFIFNNLKIKSIKGQEIEGKMLCSLIGIYVDCINSDKLPRIESGWEQLCLKEVYEVIQEIEEAVAKRARQLKERLPRSKKQLKAEQEALMLEFQQIFRSRLANNHKADEYFSNIEEIINQELRGVEEEMKVKNVKETQIFLKKQFQNIEKRVKNSELKNMGQLVKEFQIFYEYFRKKCPYKDEVQTGLEAMLKKFSDSSLIMYKNMQAKKDHAIEELNSEISQIKTEFSFKEEKLKQDRAKFQDQNARLQTSLEQVHQENQQLISAVQKLEARVEEAESKRGGVHQQSLGRQNIELKKQIMDLEQKKNELLCSHRSDLNALKQDLLLKENEISNLLQLNQELTEKYDEVNSILAQHREESALRINELMKEMEEAVRGRQTLQFAMKQKLNQKEHELHQLENTLQMKCEQLSEATNKTFLETSLISEQALIDERKTFEDKMAELQMVKRQIHSQNQQHGEKLKKLNGQLCEKQTSFKIKKLELEQEKALLQQKTDFIEKESHEKGQKIKTLQEQIRRYVELLEQKDSQINQMANEIQNLRAFGEAESQQIQNKIREMGEQLDLKNQAISEIEKQAEKSAIQSRNSIQELSFRNKELETINQRYQSALKDLEKKHAQIKDEKEQNERDFMAVTEKIKQEHYKDQEDQKRSAQLSLVQLKNFFQMQKERLEKRILEERKKFEYSETNKIMELTNQHSKQIKLLTDENSLLTQKLQDLEEEFLKTQNQSEVKILGLEEDLESQRKTYEARYQNLKKKYEQLSEELGEVEKQNQTDRISFVKRIQSLSFEISKKEKQILQLHMKKDSMENTISKKDSQIESLKKTMHQQIESSLKKVSQVQGKAQKLNQEYVQFKIEAEKQNALSKQRNQFLSSRVAELTKEKQTGSLKSMEKLDRQKISELKEQIQKQKTEKISLEGKIQNLRKNEKDLLNKHKKQMAALQKENMYSQQKLELNDKKIEELQNKANQKNQYFIKEIEEIRIKHQQERVKLQTDLDHLKEKITVLEDQKNEISWKYQKEIALVTDRIKYAEYQRDQNKKELEETQKRLQSVLAQLKRNNERGLDQSGIGKRNSLDKRYSSQMELMKISSKMRQEELEDSNKKLKEELKACKEKLLDFQDKANKAEKIFLQEKANGEMIEKLKKEKEQQIMVHRNELARESDESKKKINELEKKNREVERKNNEFLFVLEKQKAKYHMEKQSLTEKIKQLEDCLAWERKKSEPKNKTEASQKRFSATSTSDFLSWK